MAEQTASPTPVPAPTPVPTPAPAPVAAKSGSKTLLIVVLVILGIVLLCCGGTVVAWFVARAQVTSWAEDMGIDLSNWADEIDTSSDTDADSDEDEEDEDEDGSACTTSAGEDGIWYIENDEDEDGRIDRSECEAEVIAPDTGTITGTLMFPSEFYPDDLEVCAEDSTTGDLYDCVGHKIGAYSGLAEYEMELPEGDYYVYAQTDSGAYSGYKAYYSEFVECGLSVDCDDHTPIEVHVNAGDTEYGIDASDWYVY